MHRAPRPESIETLVGVAVNVARMHDSALALSDLVKLMPSGTTLESLTREFESRPSLSERYSLEGDFIIPRGGASSSKEEYTDRLSNSEANIQVARWLSTKLGRSQALSVSVSGSTSYRSASRNDDVDLFCVTRTGSMWFFLTKALLLTRASRLFKRSGTPICLSCVMDSRYAATVFGEDRGALFARDALAAEVILGRAEYARLLESARWMGDYFPAIYSRKTAGTETRGGPPASVTGFTSALDRLLFLFVGTYVRIKADFHNRNLARQGKTRNAFRALVGRDHLIYESVKYLKLKEMYEDIKPKEGQSAGGMGIEAHPGLAN